MKIDLPQSINANRSDETSKLIDGSAFITEDAIVGLASSDRLAIICRGLESLTCLSRKMITTKTGMGNGSV